MQLLPGTYYVEVRHGLNDGGATNPITGWSSHKQVKVKPNTSTCGEAPDAPQNVRYAKASGYSVARPIWDLVWDRNSNQEDNGWVTTKYYYGDTTGNDDCEHSGWPHLQYHPTDTYAESYRITYINALSAPRNKIAVSAVNAAGESACTVAMLGGL